MLSPGRERKVRETGDGREVSCRLPAYAPIATMTSLSTYVEQLRAAGNTAETGVYSLPMGMRA